MPGRVNYSHRQRAPSWCSWASCREQGRRRPCASALMPAGPEGPLPRLAAHGLGIPAGSQEQGGGLGVHQVGAVEGDSACACVDDARLSARSRRRSVIDIAGVQAEDDDQRQDVAQLYLDIAEARRQDRLHEVPHGAGLSAGRRRDQQRRSSDRLPSSRRAKRGDGSRRRPNARCQDLQSAPACKLSGIRHGGAVPGGRLGGRAAVARFRLGLAPSLLVLAVITLVPALYLLVTSLTPLKPDRPETAWDFSEPLAELPAAAGRRALLHSVWVQIKLSVVDGAAAAR